jgi:hypothetical protein
MSHFNTQKLTTMARLMDLGQILLPTKDHTPKKRKRKRERKSRKKSHLMGTS